MNRIRIAGIILASGSGTRTGLDIPKQFLKLGGQPVLAHTLRAFVRSGVCEQIVVVSHPDFIERTQDICACFTGEFGISVVAGGETRQASSYQGLLACPNATHVLIHDAVRPLISPHLISTVAGDLRFHDAVDVCVPATDTIVMKDGTSISSSPDRKNMMLGQTPQAFQRDLLLQAHAAAQQAGITNSTDDCGLVLRLQKPVFIREGERANLKITYLDDIYLAERLFQAARLKSTTELQLPRNGVKSALVIGGTRGIGASIATMLQRAHVSVMAAGRSTSPAVDVSSRKSVEGFLSAMRDRSARFDCVVYCPGTLITKKITEYDDLDWDTTYDTNVKGVFRLLQSVDDYLNPGGHFLVLGSSSYSLGRAGYAAYSSSKAALINLIQAAADEWPQYRFNVVSPQRAATGLRKAAFGSQEHSASLLHPEEIAQRVVEIMDTELSGMNFDLRVDVPLIQGSNA